MVPYILKRLLLLISLLNVYQRVRRSCDTPSNIVDQPRLMEPTVVINGRVIFIDQVGVCLDIEIKG